MYKIALILLYGIIIPLVTILVIYGYASII